MSDRTRIDDLIIKGIDKVDSKVDKIDEKVDQLETNLSALNTNFETHEELFRAHLIADEAMSKEFSRTNDILEKNTQSLREHMRRTDILESAILKMNERLSPLEVQEMRRVAVNSFLKDKGKRIALYAGILSTVVGILLSLYKFL